MIQNFLINCRLKSIEKKMPKMNIDQMCDAYQELNRIKVKLEKKSAPSTRNIIFIRFWKFLLNLGHNR